MSKIFHFILDWSEVWAILIPLAIYLYHKPKHYWQKPIIQYLYFALFVNLVSDLIWFANNQNYFETTINNNILYNIHSFIRLFLFAWFFKLVFKNHYLIYKIIPALFIVLFIIIFIFFDNILNFSSKLFTLEAAILLFYCIRYFNSALKDDKHDSPLTNPVFWIVSGLCFYTAINFFIFLFYKYLMVMYKDYAVNIWDIHNISYIILSIFIAKAFYDTHRN